MADGTPRERAGSARGLFRATGRRSAQIPLDGEFAGARADMPREVDDFYPTPPEPVRAFLAAENARLSEFPAIWEPAAGNGAMAREIEGAGHRVVTSDITGRGGFVPDEISDFMATSEAMAPAIVTNPPYHLVNWRDGQGRWIRHALEGLGVKYMALLLNWSWPGAGGLGPLWSSCPPARVYLMQWKIDFTGGGCPPNLNGWFVWDAEWQGETVLRMLARHSDARQTSLFAGAAE